MNYSKYKKICICIFCITIAFSPTPVFSQSESEAAEEGIICNEAAFAGLNDIAWGAFNTILANYVDRAEALCNAVADGYVGFDTLCMPHCSSLAKQNVLATLGPPPKSPAPLVLPFTEEEKAAWQEEYNTLKNQYKAWRAQADSLYVTIFGTCKKICRQTLHEKAAEICDETFCAIKEACQFDQAEPSEISEVTPVESPEAEPTEIPEVTLIESPEPEPSAIPEVTPAESPGSGGY